MKPRRARRVHLSGEIGDSFVRGLVSAGLLAGAQRSAAPARPRRVMRLALQGGVALAAGSAALEALRHDQAVWALGAVAAGAAGLLVAEQLLQDEITEEN